MDVVLLSLTTLSLAAAAGFGALSWRVGREERERARARIAALSTAMALPSSETPLLSGVAVGSVFDRSEEGLRGRPTIKAGGRSGNGADDCHRGDHRGSNRRTATPSITSAARAARADVNAPSAAGDDADRLRPRAEPWEGAAVNGVTAVVFAFDRTGAFVASGRAPLDFSALAPGDESPFVVNVPNVSDVARYRVTFRSGTGVVRHIDRRGNQVQLAQAVR